MGAVVSSLHDVHASAVVRILIKNPSVCENRRMTLKQMLNGEMFKLCVPDRMLSVGRVVHCH